MGRSYKSAKSISAGLNFLIFLLGSGGGKVPRKGLMRAGAETVSAGSGDLVVWLVDAILASVVVLCDCTLAVCLSMEDESGRRWSSL